MKVDLETWSDFKIPSNPIEVTLLDEFHERTASLNLSLVKPLLASRSFCDKLSLQMLIK